jgi:hypothetical protein
VALNDIPMVIVLALVEAVVVELLMMMVFDEDYDDDDDVHCYELVHIQMFVVADELLLELIWHDFHVDAKIVNDFVAEL